MRFCNIASGSTGNCTYIGSDNTHILVDTGISAKKIEESINALGLKMEDLSGILITHEHLDHILGLGTISKKYELPIYTTKGTHESFSNIKKVSKIDPMLFREVKANEVFSVGDITIHPFEVSHDAAEPVAFRLETSNKSCAIVTDLGEYNEDIIKKIQNLDIALIEANHDVNLVEVGQYPYFLKQRILSKTGHLSNSNCGKLISRILNPSLKHIILGHLSQKNNYADLAYETVRTEITLSDNEYRASDFNIEVSSNNVQPLLFEC